MNTLLWYTHDLRTFDHHGLSWAAQHGQPITGLYVFDDESPTQGPRFNFIIESLTDLSAQLGKLNIPLVVFSKNQQADACQFIQNHKVNCIVTAQAHNFRKKLWHKSLENKFSEIKFHYFLNDPLLDLNDFGFKAKDIPDIFTTFRKKVENNWTVQELTPEPKPMEKIFSVSKEFTSNILPASRVKSNPSGFTGGRSFGLSRLKHYIWDSHAILNYKETRNGMTNFDDSSKFSPWLSLGCISAKEIYWQVNEFENKVEKNDSTYWLIFELLWRDYFKFLAEKYQQRIFQTQGLTEKTDLEWSKSSKKHFDQWKAGRTFDAFINANMIELALTGWMSNRGRQNVANYLVKNLKVDWTLGAKWFEEKLIDYDCECNWGNWLYQSGFGTDPRDRIFNPQLQAEHYDPTNEYQNKWLALVGSV